MPAKLPKLMPAVLAAFVVVFGLTSQSSAALRVTLTTSGGATQTFFDADNVMLIATTIDGYTVVGDIVTTNFPGDVFSQIGQLSQSLTIFTASTGTIEDLTILAEVVTLPNALAPLDTFTIPAGEFFQVTTQLDGNPTNATTGELDGTSTVNGFSSSILDLDLVTLTEAEDISFALGGPGYTITNQLVISGLSNGVQGATIGLTTQVTAAEEADVVPEPASMAIWAVGMGALGFVGYKRRKRVAA